MLIQASLVVDNENTCSDNCAVCYDNLLCFKCNENYNLNEETHTCNAIIIDTTTIVDSINMLGKVIDVEELVKCLDFVQYLNAEKIKEMLLEYNIDLLYRKVGYVLSFYKNIKGINEDFFQFCKNKSNIKNFGAISYGEMRQLEFVSEWGRYAYKNLKVLTNKGENENV